MLIKILKKDLKKRKGINIILFLFILLATIFLSSSLNNILSVSKGITYFLDQANIPELTMTVNGISERERIVKFLDNQKSVNEYEYMKILSASEDELMVKKDGTLSSYDSGGTTTFLGDDSGKYCKVFDDNNKKIALKSGEAALGVGTMERNGLKQGDKLIIKKEGKEREFTIKYKVKDAAFGSEMSGMSRILLNSEDFAEFLGIKKDSLYGMYMVDANDVKKLSEAIENESFTSVINLIDRGMYRMLYSMDLVLSSMLILIGLCFILIAFLVMRFTLVFTMEENYGEIGIMQAIGLRNITIRKIYLVKYLLLLLAGASVGFLLSFPVSAIMIEEVSKNIMFSEGKAYMWANAAGALFIIIAVLLFCYRCTSKVNKISPVEAIRGGGNGERYHRRRGLMLFTKRRMPVPIFLGLNDILSHARRYAVLMITFCISFVLISIPLNTVNTMKSSEMVRKFGIDPDSAAYVTSFTGVTDNLNMSVSKMKDSVEQLKKDLKEKGYTAELTVPCILNIPYYEQDGNIKTIMTMQIQGDAGYLDYSSGTAPMLENEVAFSERILKKNGWKIGDTVHTLVDETDVELIITGSYSDYMQLGESARINPKIDFSDERSSYFQGLMLHMDTTLSQKEMTEELKKTLPSYTWSTAEEILNANIGGIQTTLNQALLPMTVLLCGVIALIVIMMERLFIVREKGQIAMLKSIGFSASAIRGWQIMRMVWVVLASMFAAVFLSILSNHFLLKPVFAIMGAEVNIQVDVLQAYVIYPGILLAVIMLATAAASLKINNIHIQELNNLE